MIVVIQRIKKAHFRIESQMPQIYHRPVSRWPIRVTGMSRIVKIRLNSGVAIDCNICAFLF